VVAVFSIQAAGIGPAVAVLVGATLVRGVLPPSAMGVLGERTWRLPRLRSRLRACSH
jgi:RND superfamily putative drug exporter